MAYQAREDRLHWLAGVGKGKSWLAIIDADDEAGARMIYRLRFDDPKPVIGVPLDERRAA